MKKTHAYLDDWLYQILEKYKNRRHSKNSTFNKTRGIRCWTCGAEGHLRSRCPQSNSDGENPDGSYITRVQERRPMVCYQAPPPQKIPLQCNGASLVVPGRVCGRECKMIVDTGSSHTVVRPNIVAHCKMQDTEEEYLLETARGEAIPVKGVHLAEIKIGKKTFKQKNITDDVLLGLDVMSKDFLLDLPRGIMKINNEEVPLNVLKTEIIPTRRVRIVEDATLLPEPEVTDELRCNHQDSKNEEVLVVELQSKLRRPRELIHHRRGNKECTDDNLHKKRKSGRDSMKTCHDLRSCTCGFQLGKMLPQGSFTMITRMKDNVNRMHKDLKSKMEIIYIGLTFHQESSPNEGLCKCPVNKSQLFVKVKWILVWKSRPRYNIDEFLIKADTKEHLFNKVILIFGVAGACRRQELVTLSASCVQDCGTHFLVKLEDTKTKAERSFIITPDTVPFDLPGLHTIDFLSTISKKNVPFNPLESIKSQNSYTLRIFLHIWVIASDVAMLLANAGANMEVIKRHGGWRSSTVAEGYIEDCENTKINIAQKILGETAPAESSPCSSISTEYLEKSNSNILKGNNEVGGMNICGNSNCVININHY
ncbi:hypothetical protein NQ315_012873 [Exocentrus adspersus]|uniref:CCHC-type domain-containing protein n=1 Tax=Exocentrus adspersus TaxID=1586481 RepID=A0AAV8VGP4_9CUCU|nr:hypothetical protein NQ315_012873 [Exocentrus adspersus]